jgi:hypothetical protein
MVFLLQPIGPGWHIRAPKSGRLPYVPMTKRLTEALRETRHLQSPLALSEKDGQPLAQKMAQVMMRRRFCPSNRPLKPLPRRINPVLRGGGGKPCPPPRGLVMQSGQKDTA